MFLFQTLLDNGLQPTVVSCTNLARAHVRAPIAKLRRVRSIVAQHCIKCDAAFVETYVATGAFSGEFKGYARSDIEIRVGLEKIWGLIKIMGPFGVCIIVYFL